MASEEVTGAQADAMLDNMEQPLVRKREDEEATVARADSPPPGPAAAPPRKRPRLDLTTEPRKRGKSMFGILVGTLNKAKDEDAQRSRSEAARRRMSLETKLQSKLAHEQMEIRRQAEIKRNRALAIRKEDDVLMRDSILHLTHKIKPHLSHFLTTSDIFPLDGQPPARTPMSIPSSAASKMVLYYLPTVLLPEQEALLVERRRITLHDVESQSQAWRHDRKHCMNEVETLRRQAEELASKADAGGEKEGSKSPTIRDDLPPTFSEPITDVTQSSAKVETEDGEDETLEY